MKIVFRIVVVVVVALVMLIIGFTPQAITPVVLGLSIGLFIGWVWKWRDENLVKPVYFNEQAHREMIKQEQYRSEHEFESELAQFAREQNESEA